MPRFKRLYALEGVLQGLRVVPKSQYILPDPGWDNSRLEFFNSLMLRCLPLAQTAGARVEMLRALNGRRWHYARRF